MINKSFKKILIILIFTILLITLYVVNSDKNYYISQLGCGNALNYKMCNLTYLEGEFDITDNLELLGLSEYSSKFCWDLFSNISNEVYKNSQIQDCFIENIQILSSTKTQKIEPDKKLRVKCICFYK